MNDTDWIILKTLYEQRSITKAARALFVTQSALTKRLRLIEEEWNIEIAVRTSKGVIFTEEGKYLANKAVIMLDFLSEIKAHFEENAGQKRLMKIGIPNSYARLHFPKLLNSYLLDIDKLQFKTVPNSSDVLIKQLVDQTIDIAIICGDFAYSGECIKLFKEDLYLMVPLGCTIEEAAHMSLIKYYLNPLVKAVIDQWWKRYFGSMPHEEHTVPYAEIAIEMVENKLGVCCLFGDGWRIDHSKVQLIPLHGDDGEIISRNVWLMVSEHCYRSDEIMDFVQYVQEFYTAR